MDLWITTACNLVNLSWTHTYSCVMYFQVDRGDNLPQKICDDCKKQVVHFYTFKEKSKRTEKSMQDVLQPNVDVKIESVVDSIEDDDADAFICSVSVD